MTKEVKVLVFPGDGIGKEVIPEGLRVLRELERGFRGLFRVHTKGVNWGIDYYKEQVARGAGRTASVVPEDFVARLKRSGCDAILLGALGDPTTLPDHVTLAPLIAMRQELDQYVCLRPAKLYPGVRTPLATTKPIDIAVVRENSEGEYACNGGRFRAGTPDEVATEVSIHTRKGVERIVRYACDLALQRRGHITLATKSNAIKYGMVMWDRVFDEVVREYQQRRRAPLRADKCHVDALAMDFVRKPHTLDVVVGSNLFGDILSDLGGAISGSLGLAPSANINPERRYPSMFEPVHGSALDIAGKRIANPIGTIRAVSMMLAFLELPAPAAALDRALEAHFAHAPRSARTPDLGGTAHTEDVTTDILRRIKYDEF